MRQKEVYISKKPYMPVKVFLFYLQVLRSANCSPWGQILPVLVIISKVLLNKHTLHLCIVCDCFPITTIELSSCARD